MTRKIIFFLQLILVLFSCEAFATIYDYRVIGEFQVDNVTQYVSGEMQISDQFLQAANQSLYFEINGFDLTVYGGGSTYDFSGDSGSLYYLYVLTTPLGEKAYEEQWGLYDSVTGDFWAQPFSTCIEFFTPSMIPYKPYSAQYYGVLAPTIALYGPTSSSQYDFQFTMGGGPIWLLRDSEPVPEPSTMLLLLSGVAIPCLAARRKNKRLVNLETAAEL